MDAPSLGVLRLHGALSSRVCWVGVGKLGRSLLTQNILSLRSAPELLIVFFILFLFFGVVVGFCLFV